MKTKHHRLLHLCLLIGTLLRCRFVSRIILSGCLAALGSAGGTLHSQVPNLVSYQGRVAVGTVNFEGTGQFRFALVNTSGTTVYWGNAADTTPADGVPDAAVSLTVSKGLYSVLLGDTSIANMAAIPASVWTNPDVRLRVWFNDGVNGNQLLTPDQRLTPVGYIADGAVTSAKLTSGSVTSTQLASGLTLGGTTSGTFSGTFSGNGNALTTLNATSLTSGTVADARLSSNVALRNSANTFTGALSMGSNSTFIAPHRPGSTGNDNSFIGNNAGGSNTTGASNTIMGNTSFAYNTTGSFNTGVGRYALNLNIEGHGNTAVGMNALRATTSSNNTAVGRDALINNTTGTGNIALGYLAGNALTTGSNNIHIGNLGVAGESAIIRIGTSQTDTFLTGIIHGDGSALTGLNGANLAAGSVASTQLAVGAVQTAAITDGAVTAAKLGADVGLWSAAGADVFRSAGNVGIGTAAPLAKLEVSDGTASLQIRPGELNGTVSAGDVTLEISGNHTLGIWDSLKVHSNLNVGGDYYGRGHMWLHAFEGDGVSGTAVLQARDTSGTSSIGLQLRTQYTGTWLNSLMIAPDGKVGIGTNAPTTRLEVSGDIKGSAFIGSGAALTGLPGGNINAGTVGTTQLAAASVTAAKLGTDVGLWSVSGANVFRSAGNVGIGTSSPGRPLQVDGTSPAMVIGNEFIPGRTSLLMAVTANSGGHSILQSTSSAGGSFGALSLQPNGGDVGIGTETPTAKLEVNGSIKGTSFIGSGAGLTNLNGASLTAGSVSGTQLGSNLTLGGITTGSFSGNGAGLTNLPNSATTGTAANTPNTLVLRDGSGDFSAHSLSLSGSLSLPATTGGGDGVVSIGGQRVLHTRGSGNVFIGTNAGNLTMTGTHNTASGNNALAFNTTGYANMASGESALFSNTSGFYNTANGNNALYSNTTGSGNTASGRSALFSNTTGTHNTASGTNALAFNTTGSDNTASGHSALRSNTEGHFNTASGGQALYYNTTGSDNTASGTNALFSNTTGSDNTAIGEGALYYNTTGSGNIALGQDAGGNITNTHNNICIGNLGVTGDSGIIRIGTDGTHQRTILVGNVGIGTNSPTQAKLEVNGGASTTAGQFGNVRYFNLQIDGTVSNWGGGLVSIYASDNIVASGIGLFSDARIKNITGRSSSVTDLETLQKIEITDYTMKDTVAKGTGTIKKVIAQQVEKAFPQAVTRGQGIIPDIYQAAAVENGWVMLATDLQPGDRVKLLGDKDEAVHEILEVEKERFRPAALPAGGKVFVYGREVNDLRRVDYDAISMLNVSATQELAKKLAAKDAEIARLAAENVEMKRQLVAQAERDKALEARLARLEQNVQTARVQTVKVALKK
ncbi:MAG: hypothetical protein IPK22_07210 [Verrucomicrobiaceae bacterium]|nr:hypothetical protein [Verrucomicrobiaceae bacterium]